MRDHAPRALGALSCLLLTLVLATSCAADDPLSSDSAMSDHLHDDNTEHHAVDELAADEPAVSDGMGHDADDPMTSHMHTTLDYDGPTVPEVSLAVSADPAGGINLSVRAPGFEVAPRSASTDPVAGQGHYHLYLDGEKVLRFYNDDIYFGGVVAGEVNVRVELSANDHSTYTHNGEPLAAEMLFVVPEHDHVDHAHGEMGSVAFAGPAPTLGIEVVLDPKSGFNAFITVDGMVLSAEHASGEPVDGEGHLHLYVDGVKLGRLYGTATHIPALPDGEVDVSIAAYSNDHRPYEVDGVAVVASTRVVVSP
jgi:hypothetical protein